MASEETYNDTISEKVITKKELKKIMFRSYLLQSSFNYERMQDLLINSRIEKDSS